MSKAHEVRGGGEAARGRTLSFLIPRLVLEKILERHNSFLLLFSLVGKDILGEELEYVEGVTELNCCHYCCCGGKGQSKSEGDGRKLHLDLWTGVEERSERKEGRLDGEALYT